MSKPQTVSEVLYAAADYIETHGWVRLRQHGPNGERCAWGAIVTSAPRQRGLQHQAERAASAVVPPRDLIYYNDQRGRTAEQVVRMLRRAAKRAS